jgi:hypothetical protein
MILKINGAWEISQIFIFSFTNDLGEEEKASLQYVYILEKLAIISLSSKEWSALCSRKHGPETNV